jgi:hypothetical protein
MTVGDIADRTDDVLSDAEAQALFEEARRRRRRRRLWAAAAILVLVLSLVLVFLVSTGSGTRMVPAGTAAVGAVGRRHAVRTVAFGRAFVPQQVVSASGKIWVLGSMSPGDSCALAEVQPVSLRTTTYPLPACGSYVTVGGGKIFLADSVFTEATDSDAFHIESFDTATHAATVMDPVDITTTGTGYAHMDMTFAAGSLWLAPWSNDVLEISTSTGAVVRTISGEPTSNGGHPIVAGTANGLWSAPGVGGPEVIDHLTPQSSTPVNVFTGSSPGGIWFLTVVDGRVWAEVADSRDEGRSFVTHLVAFDGSGRRVLTVPFRQLGQSAIVGSGANLWALTAGTDCTGPQRLWRIDGRTGTSAVTTFSTPVVPCPAAFESAQLAAVGHDVFVLNSSDSPGLEDGLFRISS